MKVADPDGSTWRVTRRWLPWRPRLREGSLDLGANLAVAADDAPVLLLVVGFVLIPVAVVLAVFVAEVALLLSVVSILTLARGLWLRRWPIAVRHDERLVYGEAVRGWEDSKLRMKAIAADIERGVPPRPARRHRGGSDAV